MNKIEEVAKAIRRFDRFLVTSHVNLEGDSLGSQLAMADILNRMGKFSVILDNDKVPERFRFLPRVELVRNRVSKTKFEAAIVLDCPNLKRTGRVKNVIEGIGYIINIDHHISNERFGDANWVEEDASSAGEMIYKLCKRLKCKITKETALYLYIAILTDTGSFNYSNTSSVTHEIVGELLGYGIEPYDVSKSIYENKTLGEIKLLGEALSGMRVTSGGKVAYMFVPRALFEKTKTNPASCENFVNFARSIKGVEVAIFFREDIRKKNSFHVSLRSSSEVNVNRIAAVFGGGGHKRASGCVLYGTFEEVKQRVLERVEDELQKTRM